MPPAARAVGVAETRDHEQRPAAIAVEATRIV